MRRPKEPDFVCPHCGADVPGGSKSCPECGSDERTGWSEDTYLDGVSLPEEDEDDPTEVDKKPGGILDSGKIVWIIVAIALIALWAIQSWPKH